MTNIFLSDPYYFSMIVATLAVIGQFLFFATLLILLFLRRPMNGYLAFLSRHFLLLSFVVALTAVSSSLMFSDFFKMNPCKLCWFQRIFIFPQLITLTVALCKKERVQVIAYSIAFAAFAIPVSIFHYLLQMTDAPAVHAFAPCDVTGQAPSCSGYYVLLYGYVTIPMMALTTSALILLLMIIRIVMTKRGV